MSLRELYQEMIIEHSKHPRNFHKLNENASVLEGYNPLCGDRFTVYAKLKDGLIESLSFEGAGCAISTASASLMTECAKSKNVSEIEVLAEDFRDLVTGKKDSADTASLGKLVVFEGVQEFPVRVKCATLAWHTLRGLLKGEKGVATTE